MLQAQNLSCIRGDRLLFKQVDFTVQAGGLLYIVGENGVGKSSLLKMLAGLSQPATGDILWRGRTLTEDKNSYLEQLLYIGHLNAIKEDLSVHENLVLWPYSRQLGNLAETVSRALSAVNLQRQSHLPARLLSQGQKRRLALARLWMLRDASPDWLWSSSLWILDEPFAALDSAMTEVLEGHISQHLQQGGMAIVTTHQPVTIPAVETQTYRLQV